MLYLVGKQVYKLDLLKQWRIYHVFHISLLEQDTIKKEQVDKKFTELEFEAGASKKYKVEAIQDSTVNANKAKDYLPGLYYVIM